MLRCSEMDETERYVESSSSTKRYRVRVFLPDEPWTCDCVAFAISRNRDGGKNHGGEGWCKHLSHIQETVCQWQETPDEPPFFAGGRDALCPRCGSLATSGTPTVLPESPVQAAEAVTKKLLAMAADLETQVEDFEPVTENSTAAPIPEETDVEAMIEALIAEKRR